MAARALGGKQVGQLVSGDTCAVIGDIQQQILAVLASRNRDGPRFTGRLNAVEDGVFDQRLQRQLDDVVAVKLLRYLIIKGKSSIYRTD